jgi:hypothetical protein
MPLSISILFLFGLYLSALLWVRVRYVEERKSERRIRLLIRALRSAGW